MEFQEVAAVPRLLFAAVGPSGNLHMYLSPLVDLFTSPVASPVRRWLAGKCWGIVGSGMYDDKDMWDGIGEYLEIKVIVCPGDDVSHVCSVLQVEEMFNERVN